MSSGHPDCQEIKKKLAEIAISIKEASFKKIPTEGPESNTNNKYKSTLEFLVTP